MKRFISMFLVLTLVFAVFAIADAESVKLAYKGGSIKLRTGPGKEYGYTAYLKDGTSITVLQKGSAWSKVKAGGKTGYIKACIFPALAAFTQTEQHTGTVPGSVTPQVPCISGLAPVLPRILCVI